MSEEKGSTSYTGGVGFTGLLAVLFIGLKLTGYIDWSWWWVLSPLWIPWVIIFGGLALVMGIAALIWLIGVLWSSRA